MSSHDTGNNVLPTVVVLDSLPYIDTIHPEYEQYATLLIEQEMQPLLSSSSKRKLHPRVIQSIQTHHSKNHHPSNRKLKRRRPNIELEEEVKEEISISGTTYDDEFQPSTVMAASHGVNHNHDKNHQRTKLDGIVDEVFPSKPTNMMDDTTTTTTNITDQKLKEEMWNDTLQKARMAYEKERIRSIELDVDKETSSDIWKHYNQQILQVQLEHYQQLLQNQQYQVTKTNYERQEHQMQEYQPTLSTLQYQYHDLLQKIYTLHSTIQSLTK